MEIAPGVHEIQSTARQRSGRGLLSTLLNSRPGDVTTLEDFGVVTKLAAQEED